MPDQSERRADLAAMLHPLFQALLAAERRILARHEISMWGYSVLSALDGQPARSQAALAQSIGADKTRIIGTLDELQDAGYIIREPDPADRRVHLLSVTDAGQRKCRAAQADIRAAEEALLAELTPAQRRTFLDVLTTFADLPLDDILRA
ncbi:MarR family transcriptional regulator [Actinobacteria bacterium YIM 96077]|uniref:MarR family transcriptional regulator n=1 Tax=Phytoactinopolyspora halophila TaxID=1981511 RepID=A0A329QIE9_9ACTN|nr:MarR family winged helix-turn-helix transcriptional regulator [Phytoactinopolyspora halophila]AYY13090.1 MarR family transcriptional regulator [Actinobacteria bacterium YIM 96077]RAW11102.1 MarR family transcriptional regulator [Phytoactinopolyspora halophila]